ncbi:hypothetical protein [Legionella drozanskii]|uniref:Mitochondrial carrier protein n=1 Tax=Legionella drozanskii LLAP-1 TaxID=1212489 RepID=A0A0W0TDU5_9GAMM|nr:hypothetical protein [Legionella drozanskii]KTC93742.1 hypothetical protein Ldro_0092 [Legionella drozanskii LLAP-1]
MAKDKTEQKKAKLSFFPTFFSTPKVEKTNAPPRDYLSLAKRYTPKPETFLLAGATAPLELLTIKRIADPKYKLTPYSGIMKELGIKGLIQGWGARVLYCSVGTFTTIGLLDYTDNNLFLTTVLKNPLNLPLSLFSNAQQNGKNLKESFKFVGGSVFNLTVNASFLARNFAGILCWEMGVKVRDYIYKSSGESNTQGATTAAILTSGISATIMNAWLKPFFTGKGPLGLKLAIANALLKDCWPLAGREFISTTMYFINKPFPEKEKQEPVEEPDNEATIRPK